MFDCANPCGRTGQRALSVDSAGRATGRRGAAHQDRGGRRSLLGGDAFGPRSPCDAGAHRGGIAMQDLLAPIIPGSPSARSSSAAAAEMSVRGSAA